MKSLLILSIAMAFTAPAFALKKHSKISHTVKVETDGKVAIQFKVHPDEGLVINPDENSPWLVQIREATGLTEDSYTLERGKLDESIPGFEVKAELKDKSETAVTGQVRLVAFVCTADKARCFRDVHNFDLAYPAADKTSQAKHKANPEPKKAPAKKKSE